MILSQAVILNQHFLSRFGSKLVSSKTGIILNDHLRLFSKYQTFPNTIAIKKRPLNWYTPIMVFSKPTNDPIFLISAASNGEANVQSILKVIFNYFIARDFIENPTVKHIINRVRFMFNFYQVGLVSTDEDEEEKVLLTPLILYESDYIKNKLFVEMNASDSFFFPKFTIKKGTSEDFGVVSAIELCQDPDPIPYTDARGKGAYEWIL